MTNDRFIRDYRLSITVDNTVLTFKPPLQVQFNCTKSIYGQLNRLNLKIMNLKQDNRKRIVKDREDSTFIPLVLSVGYNGKVEEIFKGTIFVAKSQRSGSNFVTTIECIDGGWDMSNTVTAKTIKGQDNVINTLIGDLKRVTKGKVTSQASLVRAKVLVGNTIEMLRNQAGEGQNFYIDGEKVYILRDDETISTFIPVVSAETGLMNQPQRANKQVTFGTMMNPSIKLGGRVDLRSKTALYLNGIYKIDTMIYAGDNYGSDWKQDCTGRIIPGIKEI